MGDTASGINWNPGDSIFSRTIMGQNGGAFKGGVDWNPGNSTLGQAAQGNWGEAGRGLAGGVQNSMNLNKDLLGGLAAPLGGIRDVGESMFGTPQAAMRKRRDDLNAAQQGAQEQAQGNQQRQQEAYNAQQLASQNQANQAYQTGQATQDQSLAAEDAFTQARNAARKAKGQTLFGGWG